MYSILKFSWSHIFAYLALIFVGYISYTGLFYHLDAGFVKPAVYVGVMVVVLAIWFIGVQKLKGVSNSYVFGYKNAIFFERFFMFTAPIVFAFCMIPFNYAMSIADNAENIENKFKESILASERIFDEYENYYEDRIADYKQFLNEVKDNKDKNPELCEEMGFGTSYDNMKIETEIDVLTRQLNGVMNYQVLDELAGKWLSSVEKKTNVWNVFFVGDIETIQNAIQEWNQNLEQFSSKILTTEAGIKAKPFDSDDKLISDINQALDDLRKDYKHPILVDLDSMTVVWGVVAYLFLLMPWLIQGRHGTNPYTLLKNKAAKSMVEKTKPKEVKKNIAEEENSVSDDDELDAIKKILGKSKSVGSEVNVYNINGDRLNNV